MKRIILLFVFAITSSGAYAQYAPQAGVAGSTAISAASNLFVGWATGCTVQRGYMDIAQPSLGYASLGDSSLAIGAVDNSIVSLGDSGVATLTFSSPIYDGAGADFAVFENGFQNPNDPNQAFLELAFVEVSSDGMNFYRFPARSLTQDTAQLATTDYMDARNLNNLAGKYVANYGTPFDLQELSGIAGLDINNVTHVRVIDVVGSINGHASKDSAGYTVNDPYPTTFPSGGFDLDAVGAIHEVGNNSVAVTTNNISVKVYPNPATDKVIISAPAGEMNAMLTDATGKILYQQKCNNSSNEITVSQYASGMYYLILQDAKGNKWIEKITKL
jgi:hypothetical protein